MKDSVNLAVDPASPDAPVEDQFFKQGESVEEAPARYDARALHEEELRRGRRLRQAGTGAIVGVGLVAVGLLIWGGPSAEPPAAVGVLSPAAAAPTPAAAPAPPPAAPVAAAPAPPPAAPAPQPATAAPVVAAPPSDALEQACRTAFDRKKYRDVVDSCARAFEAKPAAADLAILVAEVEFDRGRAAAALSWARKAVAVDPALADAYVFIGGAEQQSGRAQEARTAYLKYLELAPQGRFAQDLRAILKTL
jgi:tetratricopeptide (TPR) repeat protein